MTTEQYKEAKYALDIARNALAFCAVHVAENVSHPQRLKQYAIEFLEAVAEFNGHHIYQQRADVLKNELNK